ncbi:MAG: hypothetical protein KGN34_09840 [Sphingomonadales bacterium]|nr:hypothetical protein [Sphingomonadales bacterium]
MTRTAPQTLAALASLVLVTMTWLPTLTTPHAAAHLAATVSIVSHA